MAEEQRDTGVPGFSFEFVGNLAPDVDDRDIRARRRQFESPVIGAVVVGEGNHRAARERRVAIEVAAGGGGQHHARQIVVAENDRPLDHAARQHRPARPQDPIALAGLAGRGLGKVVVDPFRQAENQVVVGAESRRPRHHPDVGKGRQLVDRGREPSVAFASARPSEQRSPQYRFLLDQNHPDSAAPGGEGGRQPRRPAADDQHVAERVRLLVAVGIRFARRLAHPTGAPDKPLVEHPGPAGRSEESLVVEAGRKNRRQAVDGAENVEPEGRPPVLAFRHQSVEQLDGRRRDVRLVPAVLSQRDQRVGLLDPRRVNAPGPVILEAAAD